MQRDTLTRAVERTSRAQIRFLLVAKVRRLAAGCIMTITINKQGKLESLVCLEPLLELLLDASAAPYVEPGSIRTVRERW